MTVSPRAGGAALVRVGVAGWSLPRAEQGHFPGSGSHLERYAARLPAVEINSSFYRPHRTATYARWAASVPDSFRFSAKLPRSITHRLRLRGAEAELDAFLGEVHGLGEKLGCLLVQLPPSLRFEPGVALPFLHALRDRTEARVACEPRHPTWFATEVDAELAELGVTRVVADPLVVPEGADPGGGGDLVYYRLHGSPRMYYSPYEADYLRTLAARLHNHAQSGLDAWCIFDNTAEGAALRNALELRERLEG